MSEVLIDMWTLYNQTIVYITCLVNIFWALIKKTYQVFELRRAFNRLRMHTRMYVTDWLFLMDIYTTTSFTVGLLLLYDIADVKSVWHFITVTFHSKK